MPSTECSDLSQNDIHICTFIETVIFEYNAHDAKHTHMNDKVIVNELLRSVALSQTPLDLLQRLRQ